MDETPPIVESPPVSKEPAFELLNKFLTDNHINLTFKYNQPRMIADGGVIVDPPTLLAEYLD